MYRRLEISCCFSNQSAKLSVIFRQLQVAVCLRLFVAVQTCKDGCFVATLAFLFCVSGEDFG